MAEQKPPTITPRKVYLKDASFESPRSPGIFLGEAVNPQIEMNVNVLQQAIDEEGRFSEVVLHVTATANHEDKPVFLVEVQQAGVFEINADDEAHRMYLIHVGCGNMLLPFAREEIASLVSKGGFPQLLMAPINFESIYRQRLEAAQKAAQEQKESASADEPKPEVH